MSKENPKKEPKEEPKNKQEQLYNWLCNRPGYLKCSSKRILERLENIYSLKGKYSLSEVENTLKRAKNGSRTRETEYTVKPSSNIDVKLHIKARAKNIVTEQTKTTNVLFIADLHAPWILPGYLEWCKEQQIKYNCNKVIFAGDVIDSGSWSYHEHDPDGLGVKDELYAAKKQLKLAYDLFPEAVVLLGNHDLLISRKARTAGLSQEFIRDLGDVLEAPKTWEFVHEYILDNVRYVHGSTGDAFKRACDSRMSTCQGHLHSKTFVQWSVSEKDAIFGLQVGGGFDRTKYAFDYAKPFPKKPIVSCGVILENGTIPITLLMPL